MRPPDEAVDAGCTSARRTLWLVAAKRPAAAIQPAVGDFTPEGYGSDSPPTSAGTSTLNRGRAGNIRPG
jgi:hypothetical protein